MSHHDEAARLRTFAGLIETMPDHWEYDLHTVWINRDGSLTDAQVDAEFHHAMTHFSIPLERVRLMALDHRVSLTAELEVVHARVHAWTSIVGPIASPLYVPGFGELHAYGSGVVA